MRRTTAGWLAGCAAACVVVACGGQGEDGTAVGAGAADAAAGDSTVTGGAGGDAGTAGDAGSAGAAGTVGGTGGASGTGAAGGASGSAGASGTSGVGGGNLDASGGAGGAPYDAGDAEIPCTLSFPDQVTALEQQTEAYLDDLFGPYSSGAVPVYRGTATAHDNKGVISGYVDGHLSGNVIAEIRADDSSPLAAPGHFLRIVSRAGNDWMWVAQPGNGPGQAFVSMVLDIGMSGGSSGNSTETLPAFGASPPLASLAFVAHGTGLWGSGDPLIDDLDTSLTFVPTGDLVYADVAELDVHDQLADFVKSGSEHQRVTTDADTWVDACAPIGSGFTDDECRWTVGYSLVAYVAADDLSTRGVRDIVVTPIDLCCTHCDVWGGGEGGCLQGYRSQCY